MFFSVRTGMKMTKSLNKQKTTYKIKLNVNVTKVPPLCLEYKVKISLLRK